MNKNISIVSVINIVIIIIISSSSRGINKALNCSYHIKDYDTIVHSGKIFEHLHFGKTVLKKLMLIKCTLSTRNPISSFCSE